VGEGLGLGVGEGLGLGVGDGLALGVDDALGLGVGDDGERVVFATMAMRYWSPAVTGSVRSEVA
ncbi:MAG TPA: hypothetical protein VME66_07925, partial [Candidatus Acidoferrales bacterium]|nr:hypothetical protein [Candidatus Acidoferrales bacterium]